MFFANIRDIGTDFVGFESLRVKSVFEIKKLDAMEFAFDGYFEEV